LPLPDPARLDIFVALARFDDGAVDARCAGRQACRIGGIYRRCQRLQGDAEVVQEELVQAWGSPVNVARQSGAPIKATL
jgi:hypothetical protein